MKIGLYALLTAGLLLLSGCSRDEDSHPEVQIYPVLSRVTGLYFDRGDRIGLTISRASGDYVVNHPMEYDGSVFKAAAGLLWYENARDSSTLTAYYPYSDTGAPTQFRVAVEQRLGYESSDLLGAVQRSVVPGKAPIGMTFYHLMTQLSVKITNQTGSPVVEVAIGGTAIDALVDLSVPEAVVRPDAGSATIRAYEVIPDSVYRAILVPQQATLTVSVSFGNGETRTETIENASLESGRSYNLPVVVSDDSALKIEVGLSGEIADWVDGGELTGSGNTGGEDPDDGEDFGGGTGTEPGGETGGETGGGTGTEPGGETGGETGGGTGTEPGGGTDVNPDDGSGDTPQGLDYEGEHYRTIEIDGVVWMADNLRYKPSGAQIGSGLWYPYEDDAAAVATKGYLYDYKVASGGSMSANPPVRGICPEGWHIPDRSELQALAESPNRPDDFFCIAGFRTVTDLESRYGDPQKSLLMGVASSSTMCYVLSFTTTTDPILVDRSTRFGMSLRCVKD